MLFRTAMLPTARGLRARLVSPRHRENNHTCAEHAMCIANTAQIQSANPYVGFGVEGVQQDYASPYLAPPLWQHGK